MNHSGKKIHMKCPKSGREPVVSKRLNKIIFRHIEVSVHLAGCRRDKDRK